MNTTKRTRTSSPTNSNQAPQPWGRSEHINDENEMVDNLSNLYQHVLNGGRTRKEWDRALKYLDDIGENVEAAETNINKESEMKKCHQVLNENKTLSRALKECLSPKYEFGQFSEHLTDNDGTISEQMLAMFRLLRKLAKVEKELIEQETILFFLASLNQADPTMSERSKTTQPESTISLREGMVEKDMMDDLMENNMIAQDPYLPAIIESMKKLHPNEPDHNFTDMKNASKEDYKALKEFNKRFQEYLCIAKFTKEIEALDSELVKLKENLLGNDTTNNNESREWIYYIIVIIHHKSTSQIYFRKYNQ